jgi:hypothetical protein
LKNGLAMAPTPRSRFGAAEPDGAAVVAAGRDLVGEEDGVAGVDEGGSAGLEREAVVHQAGYVK